MQAKTLERYFFFGLLLATLIFTFFIFRPFWIVLVLGLSLSVVLYPVYKWINKYLPGWLSAIITLFFFVILLCIPLLGIGSIVFNQSQNLYHSMISNGSTVPFLNSVVTKINHLLPKGVSIDASKQVSNFITFLTNNIANIFNAALSAVFTFVLLLLTIFYFLKDGERWKQVFLKLSPLSSDNDQKIITKLAQTINAVIKGYLLIALIQGTLVGIGFTIFHVPNAALWGVVAGIASIIPPFGTAIVTVPAIIFLFVTGHTGLSIGLLVWATTIVGMGDNVLNPYIIGHRVDIPPFLILFSVLGGIALLGPVGILIGPLATSLLYTLTEIYQSELS